MAETGHPLGTVFIESDFIEEVVDPNAGKPVGYGELGVRVTTDVGREGLQLFQYWTEDTVVLQIDTRAGVAVARDRGLDTRIAGAMKRKIGSQLDIELVSRRRSPGFEAKARRFHDERQH